MTNNETINLMSILEEIASERGRQDDLWGEQNHPLHAGSDPSGIYLLGRSYAALEHLAKQRFSQGQRSGALILLEEVFEALSAKTSAEARTEMIQVAAVAVMIVQSIDRQTRLVGLVTGKLATDKRGTVRPVTKLALPGDTPGPVGAEVPAKPDWRTARPDGQVPGGDDPFDVTRLSAGINAHKYNGAGRLHGICRCGEGPDHPVHQTGEITYEA